MRGAVTFDRSVLWNSKQAGGQSLIGDTQSLLWAAQVKVNRAALRRSFAHEIASHIVGFLGISLCAGMSGCLIPRRGDDKSGMICDLDTASSAHA
jgi:hypothetical protein